MPYLKDRVSIFLIKSIGCLNLYQPIYAQSFDEYFDWEKAFKIGYIFLKIRYFV